MIEKVKEEEGLLLFLLFLYSVHNFRIFRTSELSIQDKEMIKTDASLLFSISY